MPIGTSDGEQFEDAFDHAASYHGLVDEAATAAAKRTQQSVKSPARYQAPPTEQVDMEAQVHQFREYLLGDQGKDMLTDLYTAYWGMAARGIPNPFVAFPKATTAKIAGALSMIPTEAKGDAPITKPMNEWTDEDIFNNQLYEQTMRDRKNLNKPSEEEMLKMSPNQLRQHIRPESKTEPQTEGMMITPDTSEQPTPVVDITKTPGVRMLYQPGKEAGGGGVAPLNRAANDNVDPVRTLAPSLSRLEGRTPEMQGLIDKSIASILNRPDVRVVPKEIASVMRNKLDNLGFDYPGQAVSAIRQDYKAGGIERVKKNWDIGPKDEIHLQKIINWIKSSE